MINNLPRVDDALERLWEQINKHEVGRKHHFIDLNRPQPVLLKHLCTFKGKKRQGKQLIYVIIPQRVLLKNVNLSLRWFIVFFTWSHCQPTRAISLIYNCVKSKFYRSVIFSRLFLVQVFCLHRRKQQYILWSKRTWKSRVPPAALRQVLVTHGLLMCN